MFFKKCFELNNFESESKYCLQSGKNKILFGNKGNVSTWIH